MMALESMKEDRIPSAPGVGAAARERAVSAQDSLARQRAAAAARRQTRDRLGIVVAIAVCGAVGAFLVSQYATLVADNYALQGMRSQAAQGQAVNAALESTVYQLSAPTRILGIAEGRLKMQPATPMTVGASGK